MVETRTFSNSPQAQAEDITWLTGETKSFHHNILREFVLAITTIIVLGNLYQIIKNL